MKTRIKFQTIQKSQNAVKGLSLSLLGKEVSESTLLWAFAPNGEVSNGIFRTKAAAEKVIKEMNHHIKSGKVGFWIGLEVVKA